jgi:hypothetical protein
MIFCSSNSGNHKSPGTQNEKGVVIHKAVLDLNVSRRENLTTFFITGLGKDNVILGLIWLRKYNSIIN